MSTPRWITALAVAAIALPVSIWSLRAQQVERVAGAADAALEHEGPLGVKEGIGEVPGQLLDLDGKTPLVGKRILFKDKLSGVILARAVSDAEGKFTAPQLERGSYLMIVEDATYEVTVDLAEAPKFLEVVVPGDRDSVPLGDLQLIEGEGPSFSTVAAGVGGGLAVVTGAVVGATLTGADGDDDPKFQAFTPSNP